MDPLFAPGPRKYKVQFAGAMLFYVLMSVLLKLYRAELLAVGPWLVVAGVLLSVLPMIWTTMRVLIHQDEMYFTTNLKAMALALAVSLGLFIAYALVEALLALPPRPAYVYLLTMCSCWSLCYAWLWWRMR
ncbi:hypothetical protein [Gallaecimonas sp. GXIMD4217]|uniref:hypothetical protein n=1 Tax=Gallaecimonas sp. GXIMD4217 TaxID=3131927 RepID=UPI00311B2029